MQNILQTLKGNLKKERSLFKKGDDLINTLELMDTSELMEIFELAERIYKAFIYDMRDANRTIADIEQDIYEDPKGVIEFLLDYIENN